MNPLENISDSLHRHDGVIIPLLSEEKKFNQKTRNAIFCIKQLLNFSRTPSVLIGFEDGLFEIEKRKRFFFSYILIIQCEITQLHVE